jgi:hypothetical protein
MWLTSNPLVWLGVSHVPVPITNQPPILIILAFSSSSGSAANVMLCPLRPGGGVPVTNMEVSPRNARSFAIVPAKAIEKPIEMGHKWFLMVGAPILPSLGVDVLVDGISKKENDSTIYGRNKSRLIACLVIVCMIL